MNRITVLIQTICCLLITAVMLPVDANSAIYRTLTDKGALHIRSDYNDPTPFKTLSLLKFTNNFTEIKVTGFSFAPYSDATMTLDRRVYTLPVIETETLAAFFKLNEIDNQQGVNFNDEILSSSHISIKFTVKLGTQTVLKEIIFSDEMVNEWHTVLAADIYADCVDGGEDLTPISSTYDLIQWGCRGDDFFYSFDILSADGTEMLYSGATSGVEMHKFSPSAENLQLVPGQIYTWKVWSAPSGIYAGKGFEGKFYVPLPDDTDSKPYLSTYSQIQWPSRGNDDYYYCIDIVDSKGKMLYRAAQCGDSLHSFSPEESLDLPEGNYGWIIWSWPSYSYGGVNFEGTFKAIPYVSTYDLIQWPDRENGDNYYCIDILDEDGNMLYRAAKCGEDIHSFNPSKSLKLQSGNYLWMIWSWPSYSYGGKNFEGTFSVD